MIKSSNVLDCWLCSCRATDWAVRFILPSALGVLSPYDPLPPPLPPPQTMREGTQFMLSCSGYPACRVAMWMPSSVESLTVSPQHCETCRGRPRMLDFTFRTAVYAPYYPRRHTACVAGCDREFLETVGLRPLTANGEFRGPSWRGVFKIFYFFTLVGGKIGITATL